MSERIFTTGNEALGYGAIAAGCTHYFGYPITPQNEIPAFFAKELPKIGGVFVQTESELSSIHMTMGACATGVRALTSTSSPGFSLMQEGLSQVVNIELPLVMANIQRGGPGSGTTQSAQTDYYMATKGCGHGGLCGIVLAPASVQECCDHVGLAYHLAEKHKILVIILSDAMIGQMSEMITIEKKDYGEPVDKPWALVGSNHKKGRWNYIDSFAPFDYLNIFKKYKKKFARIHEEEIRFETFEMDDADIAIIAYGSMARVSMDAIVEARKEGIKAGLLRPITLYPFPSEAIRSLIRKDRKFLVVEDSQGQMLYDVKLAMNGEVETGFLGILERDMPNDAGIIQPERVLREIRTIANGGA